MLHLGKEVLKHREEETTHIPCASYHFSKADVMPIAIFDVGRLNCYVL